MSQSTAQGMSTWFGDAEGILLVEFQEDNRMKTSLCFEKVGLGFSTKTPKKDSPESFSPTTKAPALPSWNKGNIFRVFAGTDYISTLQT